MRPIRRTSLVPLEGIPQMPVRRQLRADGLSTSFSRLIIPDKEFDSHNVFLGDIQLSAGSLKRLTNNSRVFYYAARSTGQSTSVVFRSNEVASSIPCDRSEKIFLLCCYSGVPSPFNWSHTYSRASLVDWKGNQAVGSHLGGRSGIITCRRRISLGR